MKCVQSVRVTPSEKTVKQGTWYYGACATVCPTNATNRRVTWHSDNPNIASVNPDTGYIYGNNYGTTNVYATSCDGSEIEDYITITVSNTVPVTSVEVNAGVITIMEGNSTTVTATVRPSDATNKTLLWTSGNPNIATVENGVITAKSPGKVIIMATSQDGTQKTSSCIVNVTKNILVNSICISPSSVRITQGHDRFLYASVYPLNATNRNVSWKSSDTSIVTINEDSGHLYAKKVGTAKVYATARDGGGACGCCCVTVEPPIKVSNITISSPNNKTSINVNQSITLSATVTPLYAEDRRVLWTTDNCNVAIVDSATGRVCGRSAGSAVIRATARDGSGVYGEFTVTVKTVHVTGVSINPTTYSMEIGQSVRFSATVSPSDATNKAVTWRSSDTSVATVNNNGCVVAKNIGTTTISVKTHDGNKIAVCDLTVKAIDTREKVTIKKDSHSFYVRFADGKIWKGIGIDLSNRQDNYATLYPPDFDYNEYEYLIEEEQRFLDNYQNFYSEKQFALLYLLDPFGVEYYLNQYNTTKYAEQFPEDFEYYEDKLRAYLEFKDRIYKEIFGTSPTPFVLSNDGRRVNVTSSYDRIDVFTDSELIFGAHNIVDMIDLLERAVDLIIHLVDSILPDTTKNKWIMRGVNVAKTLLFSGSIVEAFSDAASDFLDDYIEDSSNQKIEIMEWPNPLLDNIYNFKKGIDEILTLPNIHDIKICDKVNKQSNYNVEFSNGSYNMFVGEIIELCS